MKRILCLISAVFMLLLSLVGCNQATDSDNGEKRRYLESRDYTFVYDIGKDEQEKILELFNVKIPENEKDAFLRSFGYRKHSSDNKAMLFMIEIDKVLDYEGFFTCNKGRVKENGLDGLSLNEYNGRNYTEEEAKLGTDYYITYTELIYDFDEEAETAQRLKGIFDDMSK